MIDQHLYLCLRYQKSKSDWKTFTEDKIFKVLMTFSPRIMKWSEDTWLVDLLPTLTYWRTQLSRLDNQKSLSTLFRDVLDAAFDDSICASIGSEKPYKASLSSTAWGSILLLNSFEERKYSGFVSQWSNIGKTLLHDMSWKVYWRSADDYGAHLEHVEGKKSKTVKFKRDLKYFNSIVSKLNITVVRDLKKADSTAVGRRFGDICSKLWCWTRDVLWSLDSSGHRVKSYDDGFPWRSYLVHSPLVVSRHLDFTAKNWDEIKEYLREDLSRLCDLDGWNSEDRVVCLEWSVTTNNAFVCPILISFRMPHHMRGENPHHKTTLCQAHYNFEKIDFYISDFNPDRIEDSSVEHVRVEDECGITGWDLVVKDRIMIPEFMKSLFGFSYIQEDLAGLINRLKADIFTYNLEKDWLPESSFYMKKEISQEKKENENEDNFTPYVLPCFERPLFLLKSPQQTSSPEGRLIFSERSMDKWWKSKKNNFRRDYYLNIEKSGQKHWFFKDMTGRWYKHGIYS